MTGRICHVPGHGGRDTGAIGGDLVERDWVLGVAMDLEPAIAAWNVEQVFTRRAQDPNPTADQEAAIARAGKADLVLIHHVNASTRTDVRGLLTFAKSGDTTGLRVGDAICRAAPNYLRRPQSSCKAVTRNDLGWPRVWHALQYYDRPAVLIEYGFASHDGDRAYLLDPVSRPAIVAAVMAGVARWVELYHGRA
jgi:N-acetylmuramoyl-L-alanine amidase